MSNTLDLAWYILNKYLLLICLFLIFSFHDVKVFITMPNLNDTVLKLQIYDW